MPKHWWSKEIEEQLIIKIKNLINYFKNQTYDNLMKFKQDKAKLKQMIRKASKTDRNKLIDSINPSMSTNELWKTVRRVSGGFPSKNNIHILNDYNLANQFMEGNFPIIDKEIEYQIKQPREKIEINCREINDIIRSKKDTSSPGVDENLFFLLKNLKWVMSTT